MRKITFRTAWKRLCEPMKFAAGSTCLFVFAHPDDEVFVGGMLWDLQWVGVGVEAAWLTSGDYDGQGALREREIESAMDVIGVPAKRRHLLRLPDGRLMDFLAEGIKVIGVLLDRVRPDHVFTTAFEGGHADHDSANFLVAEALRRRASNTTCGDLAPKIAREIGRSSTAR